MCGICLLYTPNEFHLHQYIQRMSNAVRHRGPDDEGYYFYSSKYSANYIYGGKDTPKNVYESDGKYIPKQNLTLAENIKANFAMAHRRLSILDLSPAGHQPMCDRNGRYWIAFNGEIYNYIELRNDLANYGYKFSSNTDTEVIISAYAHWGIKCLDKFNGMFAFVLFDSKSQKVFIARDRFGIKPLYYWKSPYGFFAVASEIKQFTVLPGWKAKLNNQIAYDFLNWGILDHSKETFFQDVFQLRGGDYIFCPLPSLNHSVSIFKWYNLKPYSFSSTLNESVELFKDLLFDSIKLRLRADVPVGSCLSGGIDSSSIVSVVSTLLQQQKTKNFQKTFSAYSDIKQYDESQYVKKVVSTLPVDSHYIYPKLENIFDSIEKIIWHQDEPFRTTSIYAQWNVFKLASSNNTKVMLDGQGADELLAGYHNFFGPQLASLVVQFKWIEFVNNLLLTAKIHNYKHVYLIKTSTNLLLPEWLRRLLYPYSGEIRYTPNWLDTKRLKCNFTKPLNLAGGKRPSILETSVLQLTRTTLPMLLHWEDRNSMAHSIESRVPFLDYRLVELALGLPDHHKISNGCTKFILRESMRGLLPDEVRGRIDKIGFATPEEVWIKNRAPDSFREELKKAIDWSNGILKNAAMQKYENIIASQEPFSHLIWRMISFGYWMKTFNVTLD